MATGLKLGEILVKQGLIRTDQMSKALDEHKKTNAKISTVLINQGLIKDSQILKAVEQAYQVPGIDLNNFTIQPAAIQLVSRDVCDKHQVIPIQKSGANTLVVAFADPSNLFVRDDLRFISKCRIQVVVATELAIGAAIDKYYGANVGKILQEVQDEVEKDKSEGMGASGQEIEIIDDKVGSEEGPIIKFVNAVLSEGIKKKVSDIHFEPYEKKFRVRYRLDGSMSEANSQPPGSSAAIASRIKIMAKLDIAEKRRPQDGRIKIRLKNGKDMDFRVSVMPTIWGEKIVMRLLDKSNLQVDMTKLGFEPEDLRVFLDTIHLPQGLVLITGPTGSGKTTTIYSALAELNKPDVNISTAEDPVEFNFEGINQVQMNPDIDLTFANALRSFLRQDPDIIMVGEIRDLETAEISFKAASTGHLVVSTLHTNDAPQTVTRLVEMGIAPYVVSSTVNLIVAQRLVGKICEACKVPLQVEPEALIEIGVDPSEVSEYKLFKGKGCGICNGTGIKGRIAIFELMRMTEKIREAILRKVSSAELTIIAKADGLSTLRRAALLKLKRGMTTIEEVVGSSVKDVE
jgi:type IV pilus assembly protein PilB